MEQNNKIENILNSTIEMTKVAPSEDLFSKIQQIILQSTVVAPKTVWLVAASITVLTMLNFLILAFKSKEKMSSSAAYLELTINKSNQLY
ncbi:hypothetical protein [Flavobacterium sp.]|uniref:hypothetical protein n=1 Tax=Flavobacterium sp. TaxID=239 RepID=UPI0025ECD59D|nr:hypothetical protein [Flavobacterium sp.]